MRRWSDSLAVGLAAWALALGSAPALPPDDPACLSGPVDLYYVHRDFPKLTTPQWVGTQNVDAVVILSIDDMTDSTEFELFLRPILRRLKRIDGRAPVSIMVNRVDPRDPLLQCWLWEGLSLEAHTHDHHGPDLQESNFAQAKHSYDRCIDMLASIDGCRPVAFRMPYCDSRNTLSPRFWTEIFGDLTPSKHFVSIDTSVFNLITEDDPELPREIRFGEDGNSRFRRYLPSPSYTNVIEDYPYPYVIGGSSWEFPCVVPSDWCAYRSRGAGDPATTRDWQYALDAVVQKQGVFTLCFHPYGFAPTEQIVELIDYCRSTYGDRVLFLTFKEALDRLNASALLDNPLRNSSGGNGVRLVDVNADGYMDVVVVNGSRCTARVWAPGEGTWRNSDLVAVLD